MKNVHPIVFVAESPWERPAKLAFGLRKHGIPIMLLYVNTPNYDPLMYFDYAVKCESAQECVAIAARLKPKIIHIFSYHADSTAISIVQNRLSIIVYDYKDTFQNMISHPQDQNLWAAQKFLVENVDGLCCRDLQLSHYCKINNIAAKGKTVFFPDYCWNNKTSIDLDRNPDEIHVALIGTFIPEKAMPLFASHGYLFIAKVFAMSGIHLHIYPSAWTKNYLVQESIAVDYLALTQSSPFIHLHDPVPVDKIVTEISQYDFGICAWQGDLFGIPEHYLLNDAQKYGIATRIFDYLEAGLEVLTQPSLNMIYRLLRNRNVVTPLTRDTIHSLFETLACRKPLIRERAKAAREYYAIEHHIPRLMRFYESL